MFIADLHLHSAYSRATSKDCLPVALDESARKKGLLLVAAGDFTHPAYRDLLRSELIPAEEGLYTLRPELRRPLGGELAVAAEPRFIVSGEISSIYKKNGRVRKVHNLILLPSLEAADSLSRRLEAMGCNLRSDGRPILGLDSHDLLELTLDLCPQAIFIPAHIWTPHFSLLGAYSGFDTLEECFEELSPHIHALETGLSSDPPMNWRLSALDDLALISNSDAHSPAKLGREANIFHCRLNYPELYQALCQPHSPKLHGTIEFFPEEGKYHYDGHRNCHVCLSPAETAAVGGLCPVCGQRLTAGVLGRTEALADREPGFRPPHARPFESLAPLNEVIAAACGQGPAGVKVRRQYESLLLTLGPELPILREAPLADIAAVGGPCLAEALRRLRLGQVELHPGYDGEYGRVTLLSPEDIDRISGQASLFAGFTDTALAAAQTAPPAARPCQPQAKEAPVFPQASGLNPEQAAAVAAEEAAIAVIAGPGTGKTYTLVSRLLDLTRRRGLAPEHITALTFTNKAAAEMRQRLEKETGDKQLVRAIHIGTFHSLCLQFLAERGQRLTIIDQTEAGELAGEAAAELGLKLSPREALSKISRAKSGVEQESDPQEPSLVERYDAKLAAWGVVDFDDILLLALKASQEQEQPCPWFAQLLVDEFQDVNRVQYDLLRAWSRASDSLFVIGDPNQSIYGFRGADASCFRRLRQDFPQLTTITLRDNYRSTPEILAAATAVISAAPDSRHQPRSRRPAGDKLRLLHSDGGIQEARFITREITELVGGVDMLQAHGKKIRHRPQRSFSEIAVLFRTHRQGELIEQSLSGAGIPCQVGGGGDFLSAPPVRDALAFFRFLLDPADLVSLGRCLRARQLPTRLLEQISAAYAAGANKSVAALIKLCSRLDADAELAPFCTLAAALAPRVRRDKPELLLRRWIDANLMGDIPALEQLSQTARLSRDLPQLLQTLALGVEGDQQRQGRLYAQDAVRLLTFHAAKGLEFPVVFLAGLRDSSGRKYEAAELAEERRLFYVGLTRAADLLYLLTADPPFSLAAEIPSALCDRLQPDRSTPSGKQLRLFG